MPTNIQIRLIKYLWERVVRTRNPWLKGVEDSANFGWAKQSEYAAAWEKKNQLKIALTREMFDVIFNEGIPREDLVDRVLDFLGVEK